jgi:hypothetical protein
MSNMAVSLRKAQYDRIRQLAEASGLSIGETVETMLNENWARVPEALRLIERVNTRDSIELTKEELLGQDAEDRTPIEVVKENGHIYKCSDCDHELDSLKQPENCPGCGAQLNWSKQSGGGWGWALGAVAILAVLGGFRR